MIRKLINILLNLLAGYSSMLSRLQILCQGGKIGADVHIRGRLFIRNRGGVFHIGKGVEINSSRRVNSAGLCDTVSITVHANASLLIGEYSGISNSTIYCANHISIGSHVLVGTDCRIYDWDFHPISHLDRRDPAQPNIKSAPIIIHDDVFIGAGCFVLKGVRIGQGAIIGSGSVVTKDIPPFQLWAGNPARFIREISRT